MKIKLHFLALCFVLSFPIISYSQCPTTTITLSSQADVDAFTTNYPDCTELNIDTSLTISGDDIVDLSPLSVITTIQFLNISDNLLLTDLDGLDSLTSFTSISDPNGVGINNNASLEDISALSNLQDSNFFTQVSISNNSQLSSLNGLEGFSTVFAMNIQNNDSLINLSGLNNLANFDDFLVGGNDALQDLSGLSSMNSGNFWLVENQSLTSLFGFPNIQTTYFTMRIQNNVSLTDISALENFNFIVDPDVNNNAYSFRIIDNSNLNVCNNLTICNAISSCENPFIDDLCITIDNNAPGCNSISEVAFECNLIPSNDECENAINMELGEAIEAYNSLGTQSLQVPSCNDTNRIDVWFTFNSGNLGAVNIETDLDFNIQLWEGDCSNLTQVINACSENALLNIPVTINTDYYIQVWSDSETDRATGLFDILVQDATLSTSDFTNMDFSLYPNPTSNFLNLKSSSKIDSVKIYNLLGQQILNLRPKSLAKEIDMTEFISGIYLIFVEIEERSVVYRVIKE